MCLGSAILSNAEKCQSGGARQTLSSAYELSVQFLQCASNDVQGGIDSQETEKPYDGELYLGMCS